MPLTLHFLGGSSSNSEFLLLKYESWTAVTLEKEEEERKSEDVEKRSCNLISGRSGLWTSFGSISKFWIRLLAVRWKSRAEQEHT